MTNAITRVASFFLGWRLPFILSFIALALVGLSTDSWWSPVVAVASVVPLLALYALTATRVGDQAAELSAMANRLEVAEQRLAEATHTDEEVLPELDVVLIPDNSWHAQNLVKAATELTRSQLSLALLDIGDLASSGGARSVIEASWTGRTLDIDEFMALSPGPRAVVAQWPYGPAVSSIIENAASSPTLTIELAQDPPAIDRLDEAPSARCEHMITSTGQLTNMLAARRPDGTLSMPASALGTNEEEPHQEIDVDEIASLANRHRGERCVIIGNGPSLNDLDLSLLRDEVTIGVNSIFLADAIDYPLSYYVVEDSLVMKENLEAIKEYRAGYKLFPSIYREIYGAAPVNEGSLGGVSFFNMNGGFYLRSSPNFCVPRFSTDAPQRLYCGQSVTIVNLQLAYHMGFSEVYMIGMDFSYTIPETSEIDGNHILSTGDDPNHFHKDYFGKGKTWKDPKLDRVLNNYQLAKVMFEADGRAIYNATAGGMLELFERRDFQDTFGS
ncbi:MAG: hypothetical protein R8J94_09725 [Acidimicrobiia bacterium]|nr:hypothetical protein [Acidimicrobiia bacterium]